MATEAEEDRIRALQDLLLQTIASGTAAVPQLVRAVGASRPTVIRRLNELEADGAVRCHPGKGRRPIRVELCKAGRRRAATALTTPASPVTEPVTDADFVVWLDAPMSDQRRLARRLTSAGAAAVFDCHGSATVLGLFRPDAMPAAYRLLQSIAEKNPGLPIGSITVVGNSTR